MVLRNTAVSLAMALGVTAMSAMEVAPDFRCCPGWKDGSLASNFTAYGAHAAGFPRTQSGRWEGFAGVDVPNGFAIRLLGARYFEDAPIGWYLYRCNNSPKLKAITWDRAGCATWDFRYSFPTPCVGKGTLFPSLREVEQMDPLNALLKFQGPTGHATHAVHPLSCLPYFGTVNLTHSHMPGQRTFPPEFRFQNRAGLETHPPKNLRCDPAWFNCDRMSGHMAIVYSNATAVAPPAWMFNAPSWCRIGHESLQECGVQH